MRIRLVSREMTPHSPLLTYFIVKQLIKRANTQDLTLAYTVPAFVAGDVEAFLTGVARSQGRLKKVSRLGIIV